MKATCTWGCGPDVMLNLDGHPMVLYEDPIHKDKWVHGAVTKGSLDLTADEAEAFGFQLIEAARQAKALDELCEQHDKMEGGD
jgi:hypothetical protein